MYVLGGGGGSGVKKTPRQSGFQELRGSRAEKAADINLAHSLALGFLLLNEYHMSSLRASSPRPPALGFTSASLIRSALFLVPSER